ncbi:MAG TPA: hypothetical protein VLM11_21055 [Streptosporangiaceae bacterium]|nr:hypothetical protein [Streptosporangiaceae bacterium]
MAINPVLALACQGEYWDDDYGRRTSSDLLQRSTIVWITLEEALGTAIRAQFPGSDLTSLAGVVPMPRSPDETVISAAAGLLGDSRARSGR